MKREALENIDLTPEQIETVMRLNGQDVNAEIQKTTQKQQELDQLQAKYDAQEKTIKDLKQSNANNTELQQKIETLEQDLARQTEANKEIQLKNGIEKALIEAGAVSIDDALALIDKNALKLNADGSVTGIDIQVENLKNRPHLASLFAIQETKVEEPAAPVTQPGSISPKGGSPAKIEEKSIGQQMAEKLLGQQKSSFWGNDKETTY